MGQKADLRTPGARATFEQLLPRLRFLRDRWKEVDRGHPNTGLVQRQINLVNLYLNFDFPMKSPLVLPTRFGNVLRKSETCSLRAIRARLNTCLASHRYKF